MAEKQHLNGAYYGPSIPPPSSRSYHRPGRGDGCGCLGCCCSCICDCILGLICKLICTVVVIIGIAVFLFWLIVRPNEVKVHVTDASLTRFNYTNNTLRYNLAFNMTIRNSNKRLGIYYDNIEARALYQDARFDSDDLTPFYQSHKTTNYLNHTFQGQQVLVLGSSETSEFNKEKSDGVYNVDVKLYLKIRFKLGLFKTGKFKPKVKCELKVPLKTNGTAFEPTKCDWSY
ncbi:hypothetical protein L6164_033932 [Bauhinia variegata]|uniref:Uncharacterized protein n=2 Tax=Bauhinia variegata TaxID=167791 RepID=A0ACB9KTG9_BAUVA|nr:hypothetical protein L6164_033932 [Bauhinia variegata]